MANVNILYVHNVGKIGGAERVTLDVIRGLDQSAHKAFLVTPEDGPFASAARGLGAEPSVLKVQQPDSKKPLATLQGYRRWLGFLQENQIDLIHTGDLFVTRTLLKAANRLGIPIVCHVHFPIEEPALRWIFKGGSKNCHFVYCSRELHDKVAPRLDSIFEVASHQVVHNGVDVDQFEPFEPKKGLLPDDKINIGIVANLQERKGHLDLIEAIALLYPDYPELLVHVIGGDLFGESRESLLRERVSELGVESLFVFHGQVNNVADFLNELDILVCASHEEAFPISMLEAMAFGLPIASTDVNGIPEAIKNEENGLLFRPREPEEMARALGGLLSSSQERKRLGGHARADVIKRFSLARFNEQFAGVYRRAGNLP